MAGKGKLTRNGRPFFVISAYMPLSMNKTKSKRCLETLADIVNRIKSENKDLFIGVGCDFNNFSL